MKIHYFVHVVGTDTGISGIPRVVKNLGRQLTARENVDLVPVRWCHHQRAIVHAEQHLLDNLARHGGPALRESALASQPIASSAGDWLLIAEVPHLHSYDARCPSVSIMAPLGYARRHGMKSAVVFHDILPLTQVNDADMRALQNMAPSAGTGSDGEECERLRFTVYAQALANADVVFPVSRATGAVLLDWLNQHGYRAESLPPIIPILLPEEIPGVARTIPDPDTPFTPLGPTEFLTVATVCAHKNQLRILSAFNRLMARKPELDLRLHVVGTVSSDCAVSAGLLAKRSAGRIVVYGFLPDEKVSELVYRSRATAFVSLAEGYGLPVAESLWYGKPCLCSNEGSIAEIAAGGGCLPVNPRSLDEIEGGFEALATNEHVYRGLLRTLATRPMRTWADYAAAVVTELDRAASIGTEVPDHAADLAPPEAVHLDGRVVLDDTPPVHTAERQSPTRPIWAASDLLPIGKGWHGREIIDGKSFCWAGADPVTTICLRWPSGGRVRVSCIVWSIIDIRVLDTMRIFVGTELMNWTLVYSGDKERKILFEFPGDENSDQEVRFEWGSRFRPVDIHPGKTDPRCLTIAFQEIAASAYANRLALDQLVGNLDAYAAVPQ
jgi:glycosyltransferase involved in cell wall biosynthesis